MFSASYDEIAMIQLNCCSFCESDLAFNRTCSGITNLQSRYRDPINIMHCVQKIKATISYGKQLYSVYTSFGFQLLLTNERKIVRTKLLFIHCNKLYICMLAWLVGWSIDCWHSFSFRTCFNLLPEPLIQDCNECFIVANRFPASTTNAPWRPPTFSNNPCLT